MTQMSAILTTFVVALASADDSVQCSTLATLYQTVTPSDGSSGCCGKDALTVPKLTVPKLLEFRGKSFNFQDFFTPTELASIQEVRDLNVELTVGDGFWTGAIQARKDSNGEFKYWGYNVLPQAMAFKMLNIKVKMISGGDIVWSQNAENAKPTATFYYLANNAGVEAIADPVSLTASPAEVERIYVHNDASAQDVITWMESTIANQSSSSFDVGGMFVAQYNFTFVKPEAGASTTHDTFAAAHPSVATRVIPKSTWDGMEASLAAGEFTIWNLATRSQQWDDTVLDVGAYKTFTYQFPVYLRKTLPNLEKIKTALGYIGQTGILSCLHVLTSHRDRTLNRYKGSITEFLAAYPDKAYLTDHVDLDPAAYKIADDFPTISAAKPSHFQKTHLGSSAAYPETSRSQRFESLSGVYNEDWHPPLSYDAVHDHFYPVPDTSVSPVPLKMVYMTDVTANGAFNRKSADLSYD